MKAIQVLFVCRNDDVREAFGHAWIFEGLVPVQIRLSVCILQCDGQCEVWRRDMPDDDLLLRCFEKDTVVQVVLAIRSMHDKLPSALRFELKLLKCIDETVWPPPGSESISIAKRGEDLRGSEWEEAVR